MEIARLKIRNTGFTPLETPVNSVTDGLTPAALGQFALRLKHHSSVSLHSRYSSNGVKAVKYNFKSKPCGNSKFLTGFTLIEAIVSVAVFAVAFTSVSGVYISVQQLNRKSASLQALQQNARYISEDLAKMIRNGQVDYGRYGAAAPQPGVANLYLLDQDNAPVWLYRAGDILVMKKEVNGVTLTTDFTGSEIRVLNFAAYVWPAANPFNTGMPHGTEQPTVTVYLELESNINARDHIRMPFQITLATRQYPE